MSEAVIKESSKNEGEQLRGIIRRTGLTQEEFASKLDMTVQNLTYHMRKSKLTDDFKRLLKEKGITLFSEIENKPAKEIENSDIPYNIPLKKSRMAKVILPKESKASDIDTIISHLKLMKDAMD